MSQRITDGLRLLQSRAVHRRGARSRPGLVRSPPVPRKQGGGDHRPVRGGCHGHREGSGLGAWGSRSVASARPSSPSPAPSDWLSVLPASRPKWPSPPPRVPMHTRADRLRARGDGTKERAGGCSGAVVPSWLLDAALSDASRRRLAASRPTRPLCLASSTPAHRDPTTCGAGWC